MIDGFHPDKKCTIPLDCLHWLLLEYKKYIRRSISVSRSAVYHSFNRNMICHVFMKA